MSYELARFIVEEWQMENDWADSLLPDRNRKLSICRIKGLRKKQIIKEGLKVVKKHRTAECLYGWLAFNRLTLARCGLEIKDDPCPSLHSAIIWPEGKKARRRARNRMIFLSRRFKLPNPICPPQAKKKAGSHS